LLTRLALRPRIVDPATFVALRLATGAAALAVLARLRRPAADPRNGSALSACLLFAYAAPFSFAYLRMGAGLGALVLFGSVQLTVPVIAAAGAVFLLDEHPTVRLAVSGASVLGGVALALFSRANVR